MPRRKLPDGAVLQAASEGLELQRQRIEAQRRSPHTKPAIPLAQICQAVEHEVPSPPVLADSAHGDDTRFREGITDLELPYVAGVHEKVTVWRPAEVPQPQPRL